MVDLAHYDGDPSEHIAIIGMTGRFPQAVNVAELWQNLAAGVESITFFTREQLADGKLDPSLLTNPRYVGADGVIDGMDLFDADFFSIAPREAELMDPQHRMFLECAWELMEQAGYDSEAYDGRVGVWGSANLSSYLIRNVMTNPEYRATASSFQTMLANDKDFVATRVSYKLNLTGPSMSVATLCSSSFVAIHMACQALLAMQVDLGLAGAISLQASRNEAFFYQEGGIGDPVGHCRAFDAGASGTVSGSGIGLVALKRLDEAIEDGDTIHAVIRGSAVNNDGAIKYSYTAPSVEGQSGVIAEAMSLAEVHPDTITYVEAHGTGTRLGDPIEIAALTRAFRAAGSTGHQHCAIGSIKTNIGHLVNAGGVASLIKTVLAMQHAQIPPSLNFETPNPEIDFESSPFFVNTRLADWRPDGFPMRAGVSSFGIGGTNVHLIVEEAPSAEPSGPSRPFQLLLLSARTDVALKQRTADLRAYLESHPEANLADVAFTLQVGRRAFEHRRALLCRDRDEAVALLGAAVEDPVSGDLSLGSEGGMALGTQLQESRDRPVAFLLGGARVVDLSVVRELYRSEPAFAGHVDVCVEAAREAAGLDLARLLTGGSADAGSLEMRALAFTSELAMARLWIEWGVEPDVLCGAGQGELVAAVLAEVLTPEQAIGLVCGAGDGSARLELSPPEIPLLSMRAGGELEDKQATDAAHWAAVASSAEAGNGPRAGLTLLQEQTERVVLDIDGGLTDAMAAAGPGPDAGSGPQVVPALAPAGGAPSGGTAQRRLLISLGSAWLAGVGVDWSSVAADERRHRIPLPTYPFQRRRYWIEPHEAADPAMAMALQSGAAGGVAGQVGQAGINAETKADIDDWLYVPGWRTAPPAVRRPVTGVEGGWLVLADGLGLGTALAAHLRAGGHEVQVVGRGERFGRPGEGSGAQQPGPDLVVDPASRGDYDSLLDALQERGTLPGRIVHLWGVDSGAGADEGEHFDAVQRQGFFSLLFLAQALGRQALAEPIRIDVVTAGVHSLDSGDVVDPARATVLGPIKVIPQENPQLECRHLDIAAGGAGLDPARLLAELEALAPGAIAALRGRRRWLRSFEQVRLDEVDPPLRSFSAGDVVLVTSGLTDIGLSLVEHLVEHSGVCLCVIEEPGFPTEDRFSDVLAGAAGPVREEVAVIDRLRKAGVGVEVQRVALDDREGLTRAIEATASSLGPIRGLVHSVGDFGTTTFRTILDTEEWEGIWPFAARIQALPVLDEVLAEHELELCLVVSSLSSVLGGVGQAAYSAANLAMDAFVAGAERPCWLAINWDAWQLGAEHSRLAELTPQLARLAITETEGRRVLDRVMASFAGEQVVVSTANLDARMARLLDVRPLDEPSATAPRLHPRPSLLTPYVAPRSPIEESLATVWKRTIGLEEIGIDDNFFELGGDSLIAVRTITLLKQELDREIPTANLYRTPTIRALAELLAEDEDEVAEQRGSELEQRRAELARRNAQLRRRRRRT